jgi:hypothetical protein
MKNIFIFLTFFILNVFKYSIASEIDINFICKNENGIEEFILRSDHQQKLKNVFKIYKGKFIPIGEVVGC